MINITPRTIEVFENVSEVQVCITIDGFLARTVVVTAVTLSLTKPGGFPATGAINIPNMWLQGVYYVLQSNAIVDRCCGYFYNKHELHPCIHWTDFGNVLLSAEQEVRHTFANYYVCPFKQFGFKSISVLVCNVFRDVAAPCTHGGSDSKHFTEREYSQEVGKIFTDYV